jgi:hypothetical protein
MSSGEALFNVGTVGWLRTSPPSQFSDAMEISEAGDYYSLSFTISSMHPTEDQQVRTEVELENQYTIYRAWLGEEDGNFVLKAGEEREVTIYLDVRSEDLENLLMNQVDFDVSLVVSSELDVSTRTVSINLIKPEPIETGPDAGNIAWITGNVLVMIIGSVAFIGISSVALRIIRKANAPLEEISTLDGYNMTIDGWDGEKTTPNLELPSSDQVANSMFGGSKEIFQQPPPITSELPDLPPLPENGLPEGWTMEQWEHYGQEWLDENINE